MHERKPVVRDGNWQGVEVTRILANILNYTQVKYHKVIASELNLTQ